MYTKNTSQERNEEQYIHIIIITQQSVFSPHSIQLRPSLLLHHSQDIPCLFQNDSVEFAFFGAIVV